MTCKLLTIVLFAVLPSFTPQQLAEWPMGESVYICTGPEAYAYHPKKTCSRIADCWDERHVKVSTRKEAIEKYHRQPCGTCSKKEHAIWKENGWLKH